MITIAIDGTCASGKGTIATRLAQKLNIVHFDTGAVYRTVGLATIRAGVDPHDENEVVGLLPSIHIDIQNDNGSQITIMNGENVEQYIRTPQVSDICSITATYKAVREWVTAIQRDLASKQSMVMEGRDITSVVLPNAKNKFYLDANIDVRAMRRYTDLKAKGDNITLDEVKSDLIERDQRDKNRELSPLILLPGVVYIDNSCQTVDETTLDMLYIIKKNEGLE